MADKPEVTPLSDQPNVGPIPGDEPLSFDEGVEALEGLLDFEDEEETPTPEQPSPEDNKADEPTDSEPTGEGEEEAEGETEDQQTEADKSESKEQDSQNSDVLSWTDELVLEVEGQEITLQDFVNDQVQARAKDFQRDYTAKTTAISEKDKHLQQQEQRVITYTQQQLQEREMYGQFLSQFMPDEPDIGLIAAGHGDAYQEQKAYYDYFDSGLKQMKAQLEQSKAELQAQQEAAQADFVQRQTFEMHQRHPELKTEKGWKEFTGLLGKHMDHYEYTADDLNNMSDFRFVALAKDAMAYRELQASKDGVKEKVQGKPRVLKPKNKIATQDKAVTRSTKAAERLRNTGDLDDFVAALEGTDL